MEENVISSPDLLRENRLPPGQEERRDWPVLYVGNTPRLNISQWHFAISGLVAENISLSYQQFISLPIIKVHSDIHCVTGWSHFDSIWEGPSSKGIYEMANVSAQAKFVIIYGEGAFTTNLELSDFLQIDVLFALKHNDEELTPDHGYPVRLVVPQLYFWKSAKWVTGIDFSANDKPGFWESRGYHNHGDPWKEERYSSQR